MGQGVVSCVIPAARADMLDQVIDSLANQTTSLREIVVVLDNPELTWESNLANVKVLRSPRNEGKILATLRGCENMESNMVLSVDDDTILPPNCLEHLLMHLQDEVIAVCARIEPVDTSNWIGRTRDDYYRKSHTRPGLINGACFLVRKQTLQELYPSFTTMVEDQELTRILSQPYRRWMVCQEARVKTREPETLRQLFRQLVRWGYGTKQLDAKRQGRLYRPGIAVFLLFPLIMAVGAVPAGLAQASLVAIFWFSLPLVLGPVFLAQRYYSKGASKIRLWAYSFVETLALMVAATRYVLNWKPRW